MIKEVCVYIKRVSKGSDSFDWECARDPKILKGGLKGTGKLDSKYRRSDLLDVSCWPNPAPAVRFVNVGFIDPDGYRGNRLEPLAESEF